MKLHIFLLTVVLAFTAVCSPGGIFHPYEQVSEYSSPHEFSKISPLTIVKTSSTSDAITVKSEIYRYFDNFKWDNTPYYFWLDGNCPMPPSQYFSNEYKFVAAYGTEAIPHLLQYIMDGPPKQYTEEHGTSKMMMILSIVYEMLGVMNKADWIDSTAKFDDYGYIVSGHGYHTDLYAEELQNYINTNGYKPLYPFASAQDASIRKDYVTRQLMITDFTWNLSSDLDMYASYSRNINQYGPYAVPYILDYILSHEDQPLTPDGELNLGVLLHLSYRMLGVETTAAWHMPAEPVESTTDPFPYARELAAHLSEYGLEAVS